MSKSASSFTTAFLALTFASSLTAASVWPTNGSGDRGMFADRKAGHGGDILTIVVSESVAAQNSQSTKSSRDSSIADAVSSFLYPSTGLHKGALPSVSITGKASYDGGGDISNTQSLASRAAVLVTDVLPNGNLVIEGVRVVTFSGETQYVVLHGLVRADDIAADNTVQSSNIADARVEFYSEGQLTDAQKRGWLTKLYEKLRPF
ncbi:MAG TPA: flagellar basal body L-ring protein FlgH [Candidatus Didemnitutus sp.]|nr:flagellar basal body L-ring protein FlgH [Candidatus Didemnitutus sp.]